MRERRWQSSYLIGSVVSVKLINSEVLGDWRRNKISNGENEFTGETVRLLGGVLQPSK